MIAIHMAHAKLMTSFYPLEKLRKIKGLERAKYVDPYAGSKGNSIRYLSVAPRTNQMQVIGVNNLFCGGEKSGLFVGHTEAITTGSLAGANAVRYAMGMKLLTLSTSLATGDIINFANELAKTKEGRMKRCTYAGSIFFERMKDRGLYLEDIDKIKEKIEKLGLLDIFEMKIV